MSTVGKAAAGAAGRLDAAGVASSRLDARLLVAHAAGLPPEAVTLNPGHALDPEAAARVAMLVERRLAGEPVAKIVGRREFWSLEFGTTADTLDPRPDSETLIETALRLLPERKAPLSVLDLGTGTGCLLLAILSERPTAIGLGVDRSVAALVVARNNARRLGLAGRALFAAADWATGISKRFDCLVANPPYIRTQEIERLEPEVARHEPREALDGGPDGLDAYRKIAPQIANRLTPNGVALFEVGVGQWMAVCDILAQQGLRISGVFRDLAGIERVVAAGIADSRFFD